MPYSSYLSEREYITDDKKEYDRQKYEYWNQMMGSRTFEYLAGSNNKFKDYLRQSPYTVKGKRIPGGLMRYIHLSAQQESAVFFTKYGAEKLKSALVGMESCFSEEIYNDFIKHLNVQIQSVYLRTLIVNLQSCKRKGLLKGNNMKEEYEFFLGNIANDAQNMKTIFDNYPVLYRCIEEKIEHMTTYYQEIIQYFGKEKEEISRVLCGGQKIRKIIGITGNFSDVHNNGRQVLKIKLDNGAEILFKPHSMGNEKMYARLLGWIAEKTKIEQGVYPFLSYEDHSWSAIVEYKTCMSEEQLGNYYKRLGAQLFLTYLLGTKDLHSENVIASGEYPVLIDLETLVNISYNRERITVNEEIYYQLAQSVLYTGLLPFYSWNNDGEGINSSAISGIEGQRYPFKVPRIVNAGTSEMYIDYYYPESERSQNLATVNGQFQSPVRYKEELTRGFCAAYEAVLSEKKVFHRLLIGLQKTKSRFLVADTQRYAMLLSSSYHPALLKDGAERELLLWTMWNGRKERDTDIVKSEVMDLLDGDIPYFSYRLDEKALFNSRGERIENYFAKTAIDIVYEKLERLDKEDMDRQCEYIRLALELMPDSREDCVNRVYSVGDAEKMYIGGSDRADRVKEELTERLLKYAVWNEKETEVSWFKVQMSSYGKQTWNIAPMGMYLYDGLAGMLLIFNRLKETDKRKEIQRIADTLEKMLFAYTDAGGETAQDFCVKNTGAYEGESSIIYAYLILYDTSRKTVYLDYARKHARIVEKMLGNDDNYDLLSGNAGATVILLYLYERTGDKKYIAMAEQAADVLIQTAQKQETGIGWSIEKGLPPMAGLAHGNSGMLMAAAALWKQTGKEKYGHLAEEIWQYENSLYNPKTNNWNDVRDKHPDEDITGAVAWCHGAAGILLSRLYCYENACTKEWEERMRVDMLRAYDKLKGFWLRDSWCLCHGTCGNLWILEKASKVLEEGKGYCITPNKMAEKIKILPQEKINPGFMNGYGGILYSLLNF